MFKKGLLCMFMFFYLRKSYKLCVSDSHNTNIPFNTLFFEREIPNHHMYPLLLNSTVSHVLANATTFYQ